MTNNAIPAVNYLNTPKGLKSWLLTRDHKRIGLMYLFAIMFFFLVGGIFALLIRWELLTPAQDLMTHDTYNKMFTLHGAIMIFLFIIPSIPAALGNFVLPLMLGAKDVAFPRLNLASWYVYVFGALFVLFSTITNAVDTGWTFYTPILDDHEHGSNLDGAGSVHSWILVDLYRDEFHCDHSQDARTRHDLVQHAAFLLGTLRHRDHSDSGNAGAWRLRWCC